MTPNEVFDYIDSLKDGIYKIFYDATERAFDNDKTFFSKALGGEVPKYLVFDDLPTSQKKILIYLFINENAKEEVLDKKYNPSNLIIRKSKDNITEIKQNNKLDKSTDDILENDSPNNNSNNSQLELFEDLKEM